MTPASHAFLLGQGGEVSTNGRGENPPLNVVRFERWESLQPWAQQWDRLARGVPFRSWAWQSSWWDQYGADEAEAGGKEARVAGGLKVARAARRASALSVLGVFATDGGLVGLLPLYRQNTWWLGRVLRFLGSGEVCSEYLSILCEPEWEAAVASALATWLAQANRSQPLDPNARWDLLELSAVDAQDSGVARLAAALEASGHAVHCRPGPPCWRVPLASSWEGFLRPLSRNRRRKFRLLEREFVEGGAQARCVERPEEIAPAVDRLIAFQQARRRQLKQRTCFDSPRFTVFLRESAVALWQSNQLALIVVEKDHRPLAVELTFRGPDRLYAYQAGIDGSRLHESPGHLGTYALVRYALEHGLRILDFLRGDEPYKADWEAQPHPTLEFRVAARGPLARLRHAVWRIAAETKIRVRRKLRHAC